MATTFNWIYLGKAVDIDTAEANTTAENAGALVGTSWGSAGAPLHGRIASATPHDANGDGALSQDAKSGAETFATDIGAGMQTFTFDAAIQCNITLTYADGTTGTGTMVLAQGTDGHLFLAPQRAADGSSALHEAGPIVSLRVNSVVGSNFSGLATERLMTGWDDGIVNGTDGDDLIDDAYREPVAQGSDRVDNGDGTAGAGSGWNDDSIGAGAGNDTVLSGAGTDTVDGGTGSDSIDGGDGNDSLLGGAGSDTLLGGSGNDPILGGTGNDTIFGGDGSDQLSGDDGDDSIDGGADGDVILGGAGADTIAGGDGGDLVDAGTGNDQLFGGDGADNLSGGDGDDTIDGGAGGDLMTGGLGSDRFTGLGVGDLVDGSEDTPSAENDVLDLFGSGWTKANTNILYSGGNDEAGTVEFFGPGNVLLGTLSFSNIETIIPCFTPGTLVDTAEGPVAVEDLCPGDLVLTRDSGYRPLRWSGRRDLAAAEIEAEPRLAPVVIRAGALGPGCPARDTAVSPQHRMLVTGSRALLVAGEAEVLAAALHLVGRPGIARAPLGPVSYIHLLFDDHEIVRADGAWSESFQPAAATLAGMGREQRTEILALFPDLARNSPFPPARQTLRPHEARAITGA